MSCQNNQFTRQIMTNKKKKLSNYNKKNLLSLLKECSCHPKELKTMKKRFRLEDENVIKGKANEVLMYFFFYSFLFK